MFLIFLNHYYQFLLRSFYFNYSVFFPSFCFYFPNIYIFYSPNSRLKQVLQKQFEMMMKINVRVLVKKKVGTFNDTEFE